MAAIEEALPSSDPLQRIRRLSLRAVLALGLLVATLAFLILDIVVWGSQRFLPPPVSFIKGQAIFIAEMFYSLAYAAMGWLLATRLPRNPIGWLFQYLGVSMAAQLVATFLVQQGHQIFRPLEFPLLLGAWASSSLHLPSIAVVSAAIFALFPHGRTLSPRWRLGIVAAAIGGMLTMLSVGTLREGLLWYPSLPNPFAVPESFAPVLSAVGVAGLVLLVAGVTVCAASIAVRYRRAHDEDERAQVLWIATAVLLLAGAGVPFLIARYALRVDYSSGEILLAVALLAGCFLPIAAAIAILRHGLYNIDVIINRALVYIPLTAILAGSYAAGVAMFQRIFVAVTGDRSDAAIVITTLFLASFFTPIKNWLQTFVDKRFKPLPKPGEHGAQTEMQALTARVAALEEQLGTKN